MSVLFISSGNTGFDIVPFIKSQELSLVQNGINIDHFVIKGKGLSGYFNCLPTLKKQIKEKNYDLIHAHYSFCGWVAVLSFPKLPIVVSYMGSDVYGLVNKDGKRKLRSYLELSSSQLLQPFVDKIIVKSRNLKRYVYLENKAIVIPNGVDFEKFKPRDKVSTRMQLKLNIEKRLILFLGNPNDARKNFKLLEEAIKLSNQPEWEIVNPYPISPDLVPYYINASDVVVLTSYLEGSPNIVKEAMASNCPVISTDVGDVKEIITDTPGCYLTKFDASDLITKLKLVLNQNVITNGRDKIAHLEINTVARDIIKNVYQKLNKKLRIHNL